MVSSVVAKLTQIQASEKLTDAQVAGKLEIHTISWSRIKNGRSNMDLNTLRKAVKAYPNETAEAILQDLFGPAYLQVINVVLAKALADKCARESAKQ